VTYRRQRGEEKVQKVGVLLVVHNQRRGEADQKEDAGQEVFVGVRLVGHTQRRGEAG
jgi:hypothetical protein